MDFSQHVPRKQGELRSKAEEIRKLPEASLDHLSNARKFDLNDANTILSGVEVSCCREYCSRGREQV